MCVTCLTHLALLELALKIIVMSTNYKDPCAISSGILLLPPSVTNTEKKSSPLILHTSISEFLSKVAVKIIYPSWPKLASLVMFSKCQQEYICINL
jgi:hypothetical protein